MRIIEEGGTKLIPQDRQRTSWRMDVACLVFDLRLCRNGCRSRFRRRLIA